MMQLSSSTSSAQQKVVPDVDQSGSKEVDPTFHTALPSFLNYHLMHHIVYPLIQIFQGEIWVLQVSMVGKQAGWVAERVCAHLPPCVFARAGRNSEDSSPTDLKTT